MKKQQEEKRMDEFDARVTELFAKRYAERFGEEYCPGERYVDDWLALIEKYCCEEE